MNDMTLMIFGIGLVSILPRMMGIGTALAAIPPRLITRVCTCRTKTSYPYLAIRIRRTT